MEFYVKFMFWMYVFLAVVNAFSLKYKKYPVTRQITETEVFINLIVVVVMGIWTWSLTYGI